MSADVAADVVFDVGDTRLTAAAALGEALQDVCDTVRAPVSFSCRDANCGTCVVHVASGADRLSAAGPDETRLLAELGLSTNSHRLACRARIGSAGAIHLRPDPRRVEDVHDGRGDT